MKVFAAGMVRFSLSNSVTDEVGALFLAVELRPGRPSPDPTEELAVRWATLDEVLGEIASGGIHDLLTIAGVGLYAASLGHDAPAPGHADRAAGHADQASG